MSGCVEHRGGKCVAQVRGGRGALRVDVGPRLPAGLQAAGRAAAPLPRRALHGAHRHRRAARARGHPAPAQGTLT